MTTYLVNLLREAGFYVLRGRPIALDSWNGITDRLKNLPPRCVPVT